MQHFDVVVIGAGPAGAAAALQAAQHGCSVAIIDRADFPRDKLCGGGITGHALRECERVFGSGPPKTNAITSFEFHAHGRACGTLTEMPPMYLTTRLSLDNWARGQALDAGAIAFTDQLADISDAKNAVMLRSGLAIGFGVLIGADGVKSQVAKHVFGQSFDPAHIGFALEIEAKAQSAPDTIRIDFGAAQWGYGWQFPKTHSTTIGVGGIMARNPELRTALSDYLHILGAGEDHKVKGHHLPFGQFRKVPGRGHILLAGDAAGLVDPITGEGIAHAITSGAAAGLAAAQAVAKQTPDCALALYQPQLRGIHQGLRIARRLRTMVFAAPFRNLAARGLSGSGGLRVTYLSLLAGNISYPAFLRRVILLLPARLVSEFLSKLTRR